ncbi:hypothetical protein SNQ62_003467 [Cronobacter sakazakii]|nr:hypothetical protein [Cronobacter sakazakii]
MKLTKEEKAWVKRVQKALDSCPSTRLAFATIGDCDLSIFNADHYDDICNAVDSSKGDFIQTADKLGYVAQETLRFPNQVESTAG